MPAPTAAPPNRRPLRRFVRGAATLAAIVVALLAAAPWIASRPAFVAWAVARAVPDLQADVRVARVRLGWFAAPVLDEVSVVPRNDAPVPLTIRRVAGSHGLLALLLGGGDLGRLRVDGLEARLMFTSDRRSNLHGLFGTPLPGAAAAPAPAAAPRRPLRLRIEVEDAIVRVAGPWSPEPWASQPIDIRATLGPNAEGQGEWTVDPVQLAADARLEPAVTQGVLAYIAPLLAESARAAGRFSLRLDEVRLPAGRPGDGRVAGTLIMHEVVLGPGPVIERIVDLLPGGLRVPDVRVADEARVEFRVAERRVWHDGLRFGLPLAGGRRLDVQSKGWVGLDDRALDIELRLPFPDDVPRDRPLASALAGKTVTVGVRGELGKPKLVFDGSIAAAAGGAIADLVDRLRDPDPPADGSGPPAGEAGPGGTADGVDAVLDAVGDVVGEIARRRAERRAAGEDESVSPRRGRLRDRLRPRPPTPDTPAVPPSDVDAAAPPGA